jgi:hypothetical protein
MPTHASISATTKVAISAFQAVSQATGFRDKTSAENAPDLELLYTDGMILSTLGRVKVTGAIDKAAAPFPDPAFSVEYPTGTSNGAAR